MVENAIRIKEVLVGSNKEIKERCKEAYRRKEKG